MPVYSGSVVPIIDDDGPIGVVSDNDYPFLAMVADEKGRVVAQCPVRNEADGAAKIEEMIADLNRSDAEGLR